MRKIKQWLIGRFLPAWCREELLSENLKLTQKVQRQAAEIDRLRAYIEGLHKSMRYQPKIIVNGGAADGHHERDPEHE